MDMKHDTSSQRRGRIGAALFVVCAAIIGAIGLFGVAQRPSVLVAADCSRSSGSASTPPTYRATLRAAADVWDGTTKTKPTIDGQTVKITSAAELAWLATSGMWQESDITIEIMTDIDLAGHEWSAVVLANNTDDLNVTLNGNGHVIKGLTANGKKENFGLCSSVGGDFTASDLHLVGVDINTTEADASFGAALIGGVSGAASITNCTVQGSITTSGESASVGALIGRAQGGATIERCVADITIEVNGTQYYGVAGGLVGEVTADDFTVENCAVYGSVAVTGRAAGGVVGLVNSPQGGDTAMFVGVTNLASVSLTCAGTYTDDTSYGAGGVVGVADNATVRIQGGGANRGAIDASGTVSASQGDLAAGAGGFVGAIYGKDRLDDDNYSLTVGNSVNIGAVTSKISATAIGGYTQCLGAGGFVGSSYYKVTDPDQRPYKITIGAYNIGSVTGNATNSAGGMIGYLYSTAASATDTNTQTNIRMSYNRGAVSAPGGTSGGFIGSLSANSNGQAEPVELSGVYSSVVPTGTNAYGFFGTYVQNAIALNAEDAKHATGVNAFPTDSGTYAASMNARATFVEQSGSFWNGYLDNGVLPPDLDRKIAMDSPSQIVFAIRSTTATRRVNGNIDIRLVELPDVMVLATDAEQITYDVKVGGAEIASGLRTAGGVLTIPAHPALVDGAVIELSNQGDYPALLSLNITNEPSGGGEVRAIAVRGTPIVPEDSTSRQLYIEWTDADGAVHSSDRRPSDSPTITWSVDEPESPNWDVSVTPLGDNMSATLTIGASKREGTSPQEYGVRVRVSYGAASEDIVYVRKFYAGSFPTKVMISPEDEAMIDAANAVLARTRVSILPGNFQRQIPDHIKHLIESRLAEGLVNYATDQGALSTSVVRAAADPSLYVLRDMDMIQSMMHEPAQSVASTLPVCFKTASKDSANIELDLGERPELAGYVVLLPMTYSVTFTADNMQAFFGANAASILASPTSAESLAKIFEVLVLHKRIKEGDMTGWYTRLVDGVASPSEALALGMLQVDASDGELTVRLAYNVINFAGESFVVSAPYTEGGSDTTGYIILPDGLQNSRLVDPLWSNLWARGSGGDTGGSGGGCAVGSLAVVAFGALCVAYRRRRRSR